MKKTISILLAAVLCLSIGVSAFAESGAEEIDYTTCTMGKTDENGVAVFEMEEGPIYIVHVLKVPAGYVKNDAEFATDNTYCDIYIPLEKAA